MVRTVVVHVNDRAGVDVYIGRANPRRGLRASPFANPFRIGDAGDDRAAVIERYRQWILARPFLVEAARRDLTGKRLGCWCAPKACHGDVLVEICDG